MGGEDFWSNGIHLNHIEAASDPANESWQNIHAIDDLIKQIIQTPDKLTIAAVAGNAGAGGAILALAADKVWARNGVVFNPHYQNMGGLYGSEYWTYLLPKRVGAEAAERLTSSCLPLSAKHAWQLGMIDQLLDGDHDLFAAQVKQLLQQHIGNDLLLLEALQAKASRRCRDEAEKPLAVYRQTELVKMFENFFGNADYHQARQAFVFKQTASDTPRNIAAHRQADANPQMARPEHLRVISAGKPRKTATLQNS
jgi:putative two-component system hydrogenase maturation factor HypX/HoxX